MKNSGNVYLSSIFALGFAILIPSQTAQADVAGVFSKGQTHFSVYGGTGSAFDDNYFVIGASVGYYIANGFSLGLAAETWTGGDPGISKVSPSLNYVFYQPSSVKPYVGVFYRHTYIEDLPDLDSVGGRAGIYITSSKNSFIGLGGVYESYLNCNENTYTSCDDSYPEVSFTFVF